MKTGQRVTNALRVTLVGQILFKGGDHAAVVECFALQQGAAVTGGAMAGQLGTDSAVARGRAGR
ncbi:hypothetical protein BFR47_08295 [Oceanisphaera psychrotolerans]|uniref:Uncharacterized protein n=1 Tax=Oceanisphaera psychrotolerans TaxID=1414654 RepID=A0A1J4QI18_9GAMM|nr:hypothetical protein BFR47_08295 [Oceanisphaera psychrotolerans]